MSEKINKGRGSLVSLIILFALIFAGWQSCSRSSVTPSHDQAYDVSNEEEVAQGDGIIARSGNKAREHWNDLMKTYNCRDHQFNEGMPNLGFGEMYSCVAGEAQTVKLFVNQDPATGAVKNVKFMWNDWHRDLGYGLHADKEVAQELLQEVSNFYASGLSEDIVLAFFGNDDKDYQENGYYIAYSFTPGPGVNERLLTIIPKEE